MAFAGPLDAGASAQRLLAIHFDSCTKTPQDRGSEGPLSASLDSIANTLPFKSISYSVMEGCGDATMCERTVMMEEPAKSALQGFVDAISKDYDTFVGAAPLLFVADDATHLRFTLQTQARRLGVSLPAWLDRPRYVDLLSSRDSTVEALASAHGVKTDSQNVSTTLGAVAVAMDASLGSLGPVNDPSLDFSLFQAEKSRVLYLTGLPADTTQSELEFWFTQYSCRPIAFWHVRPSQANFASGYAVFASNQDAIDGLAMRGRTLQGIPVEIQPSSPSVLDKAHDVLGPFPSSKNKPRPGDWACPSCGFSNFQRRVACFRCSFPAASAATVQSQTPGTSAGTTGNHGSTTYNDYSKPSSATSSRSNSSVPFRAGDWNCLNNSCSYHNFAKNITCLKCGAPRVAMAVLNGHPHPNQYDYSARSNSVPQSQYKYGAQAVGSATHNSHNGHSTHSYYNTPATAPGTSGPAAPTSAGSSLDLLGSRSGLFNSSVPSTPTFQSIDYDLAARIGGLNLSQYGGFTLGQEDKSEGKDRKDRNGL